MDFGTKNTNAIVEFKSFAFPEDGARATPGAADVSGDGARSIGAPPDIAKSRQTADTLPTSLLANWGRIAQANISVRMYNDLMRVATRPPGWRGPGSLALRPSSLKNFLEFWSAVRDGASEPQLSLAPDGSIHAEWYKSARQRLDARFLDQKVIFGLFANKSILEGIEPRELLVTILKAHHAKPMTWSAR